MSVRQMPSDHKRGNKWRAGHRPANAFEKGHDPWNKGVKGIHLSPDSEWQPGMRSRNHLPVGSVSIRPDKSGRDRAFVKTAEPNTWRMRAVLVWEATHGPTPKGKVIHHKDRDALNDVLDNLSALTRKEHIEEHRGEFQRKSSPCSSDDLGAETNRSDCL